MDAMYKAARGTQDVLPADSGKWQYMEQTALSIAQDFGYREIRTPVFEQTALFQRSVGETTDVVQKEMYTFLDKGERSVTLRPEGTAGAARAALEHGLLAGALPVKTSYVTSCYRYEKPQAGRLREFHQFGVECFGAAAPQADAEIITLAATILESLGVTGVQLHINSIGCPECRAQYHAALKEYFAAHKESLCGTCLDRLERNPMRILDCKSPECAAVAAGAPVMLDYLCDDCAAHFEEVKACLTDAGLSFEVDPHIVRGLDYYTRTVFEFISDALGAQSTVCGGGRYDGLVEEFGGKPTPGLGFGLGLDRIMMAVEAQQVEFPQLSKCEMYIATMGEEAQKKAFLLLGELHRCGIPADTDLCGRGLKAQMKYADKIGAKFTMVLGDNELQQGKAEMKNMKTGEKRKISISGEDFINDYVTVSTEAEDFSQDGIFF